MDSPLLDVITEIVMQYIEDKINHKLGVMLKFWSMYVDIFIVSRNEDLYETLAIANSICPSIHFTIEKETNYQLSFLNIYIEQKEDTMDQKLSISIYCKEIFSDQYLNFHSESYKVPIAKTLAIRALR